MSRWWRAYDEAVDDPKLILLTDKQHRAWFNLCCITSQNGGTLPALAVIAVKLRTSPDKARGIVAELVALGLVDNDGNGVFAPHNWNARQYKSDEPKGPKGKDSYVYIIGHAWGADALKIGFSKNPWARIGELQTAHHEKLSVLAVFKCRSHSEVDVHDLLKPYRKSGEWFSLPTKIYVAINSAADRSCSYDDLVAELRNLLRSATTETEAENRNREDSEATASAADAAPTDEDPRAKLFRIGKTTLVSFGVGEKRTGSLIGQWLKERNDPAGLLAAIEYAREQNVAEPVAYISTLLSRAKTNGHRGKQDLSAMCFAIADELRQQERARGDGRSDELFRSG